MLPKNQENKRQTKNKYVSQLKYQIKLQGFGSAVGKNEAVRRGYVSSILLAAVLSDPGTWLGAERVVEGGEIGRRVDYAILKDNELICISEVKESDVKEGIAMNIIQLDSSLEDDGHNLHIQNNVSGWATAISVELSGYTADGTRKDLGTTSAFSDSSANKFIGADIVRFDADYILNPSPTEDKRRTYDNNQNYCFEIDGSVFKWHINSC
ncbi:13495_t:CDS:2 [Entrophospora sp. SA101]|nr:13495_t:CDS:2 [Entrophospora sp. SA101]